jgi:hypothetical protein
MDNSLYILELPFLKYDKDALIDYMKKAPKGKWQSEGYVTPYLRPKEEIDLFTNLYKQLPEFEINIGRTFFAELGPNVFLRPHTDEYRSASINIPLIGDYSVTPVKFHSEKSTKPEHLLYTHYYNTVPTIINTTIYHSVFNPTDQYRYMFSLSVYADWKTIGDVVQKYKLLM